MVNGVVDSADLFVFKIWRYVVILISLFVLILFFVGINTFNTCKDTDIERPTGYILSSIYRLGIYLGVIILLVLLFTWDINYVPAK